MPYFMISFGNVSIAPSFSKKIKGNSIQLGCVLYFVYITTPTTFSQNHFETLIAFSSWSINVHVTCVYDRIIYNTFLQLRILVFFRCIRKPIGYVGLIWCFGGLTAF